MGSWDEQNAKKSTCSRPESKILRASMNPMRSWIGWARCWRCTRRGTNRTAVVVNTRREHTWIKISGKVIIRWKPKDFCIYSLE